MASKDSGGQERASRSTGEVEETVTETTSDVDDLLDEIDEVLESNAEEFVRSYVQKGGQ